MILTIIAGIFLVVLLLIRSKRHQPFITNKILNTSILVLSLLFILSGIVWFLILLIRGSSISEADVAISLFLVGIAITGFIAETPEEAVKSKKKRK